MRRPPDIRARRARAPDIVPGPDGPDELAVRRARDGLGERGLTLLELVVAVVVLSLGSLAAVRATDQSRHALAGEAPRLLARVVAENRAEALRFVRPGTVLPRQVEMGGQVFDVDVAALPTAAGLTEVTIRVQSAAGPGARLVTYLPGPVP